MKESDVYEFVDVNAKRDENILTVDFYFDTGSFKEPFLSQSIDN